MMLATLTSFIESLQLQHIAGFVIVMVTLAVMWGMVAAIGYGFIRAQGAAPAVPAAPALPAEPALPAAPAAAANEGLTEEEVAVIAACVSVLAGTRSRVVSIRPVVKDWSREGRREHFASHKIR